MQTDVVRRQRFQRRGGGWRQVTLADGLQRGANVSPDIVAVDDPLEELAKLDPRKARVVELRFFGGLSLEETALLIHEALTLIL